MPVSSKTEQIHPVIFRALVNKEIRDGGNHLMTEAERDYCLIAHFDAEVRNGGFSQFFTNAYGSSCDQVLAALEKVGARTQLQLLQEFLSKLPSGVDLSDAGSMAHFLFDDLVIESTEILNDRYYAASDEFYRAMITFATGHKHEFVHVDW